ncbi:MAG: PIG-L family deacetylase [Anaerolineae bacterium]
MLVVVAHPDDPEFPAGGTIASTRMPARAWTCAVRASSSRSTGDRALTEPLLAAKRFDEQWAAARSLGVADVVVSASGRRGRARPGAPPRDHAPDRLHRPGRRDHRDPATFCGHVNHPDHRAVVEATLEAIFRQPTS